MSDEKTITAGPDEVSSEEVTPDDLTLSYEEARARLGEVVQRLEAGGITLEESLALWERGETLAALCQRWLDGARVRLDRARATVSEPPA